MTNSIVAQMRISVCMIIILFAGPTLQAQTPTAPAEQPLGRMISLVTEQGNFESKWDTVEAARSSSAGNSYNRTLKLGNEIIILNSRCDGEVSYSLFSVSTTMLGDIKKLKAANLHGPAYATEQQKLVNSLLADFDKNRPAKPTPCDPVAVELSFADGTVARLEHDDVGSPLVGTRLNDAYVFEATRLGKSRVATMPGSTALTGGLINGFTDAKAAMFAASKMAGTEIAVIKGDKIYLYRATGKLIGYSADDAKLAALKAVKPAKGLEILAMITGSGENMKVTRTDGR